MKLKKMIPELVSGLIDAGYDKEPREIQSLSIPKIKSGADVFMVAPEGSGKSTALNIALIQQLKKEEGEAPRAIVVVENKDKAFAMDEQFEMLAKNTSLRSLLVYDQGIIEYQKDMIYIGIDVLFTTPKRFIELMNITGVPMGQLKTLIIDDAETIFTSQNHTILHRMADANPKVQIILSTNQWNSKFDDLSERVMKNPQIVESYPEDTEE